MNTTPSSTLHFTSTTTSDGIAKRTSLGGDSDVLWSPESAIDGAPLLPTGHGGGLHNYAPGLVSRTRRVMAADGPGNGSSDGFTAAAVDASKHGDQPRSDQDQRQVDAMRRARATGERALVLAGAGAAGNAWEIGVVAGLFDAGSDVTEADLVIGTSAGSTVAAQITSATQPTELLANILAEPQTRTGPVRSDDRRAPNVEAANMMEKTSAIIAAAEDAADMRRRMGAAALETETSGGSKQWRAVVAARLPSQHWPQQPMLIVAVDAHTGEPVVFDRHSGVDLVDAVAASTSNGSPYSIGDRRYINGGYRRNENADLAAGHARVLVLSPFGGRTRHPLDWGMQLAAQVGELRAHGSRVETIFPDSDSEHMFGANAMDLSTRPPAARAGYKQGRALTDQLTEFWR